MKGLESVLVLCLGCLTAASAMDQQSIRPEENPELGKRLYDFGLGKRTSRYVTEFKRLPMYDFGLGKRSKMYSFGLGKRSNDEEGYDNYLDDGETIPETEMYDDDAMQLAEKRQQRMYAFGLGKRPMYEFGLGKRARQYDFGLGKRERMYSFGLGKRPDHRYSFGLGKRSIENVDEADNGTAAVESHEEMGHGSGPRSLEKRSPRQYSFGLGKRSDEEAGESILQQFREPSSYYGKRRQMYAFGLGKRSQP